MPMIEPKIWGKHGWIFLHSIALSYPNMPTKQEQLNMKNFFTNIAHILPCNMCRDHYKLNLIKHPLDSQVLKNSNNLNEWLIKIHNEVNLISNKKMINITPKEVYENISNKSNKSNYYFILILIILIAYYFYKKK
jgi:hypothetical protein